MLKTTLFLETTAGLALLATTPFRVLRDPTMKNLEAAILSSLVLIAFFASCLVLPFVAVLAPIGHVVKQAFRPSPPQHPF